VRVMNRAELLAALDVICEKLRSPLPKAELDAGWTSARTSDYLRTFEAVRAAVQAGRKAPDMNAVRTMDHSGIVTGELFDLACAIENAVSRQP
jgi:hypothetical protein